MKLLRRTAVLGGAISVALICTAAWGATGPAAAGGSDRTFTDARGDVPVSVDIERVRVVNRADQPLLVTVDQQQLRAGDGVVIWLDTDPARPGPDYVAGGIANSDVLAIAATASWTGSERPVRCDGFRLIAGEEQPGDRSLLVVPRRCLGNPGAVRVSVMTLRQTPLGLVRDFAPAPLQFYPWVPG